MVQFIRVNLIILKSLKKFFKFKFTGKERI